MFLAAAGMLLGTMTESPTLAFLFMCLAAIGTQTGGSITRPASSPRWRANTCRMAGSW
jgi:hypothetical protein